MKLTLYPAFKYFLKLRNVKNRSIKIGNLNENHMYHTNESCHLTNMKQFVT